MLALFVAFEDFTGAIDYAARKAGEAGDFNTVALIGAAGFDATKKNNFAGSFIYGGVNVFDGGQQISEFSQFMVMGGEEGAGASVFLQMFDDGPGDRQAVESGGAASYFVEQDEAGGRGVIQDGGNFGHFHKKSGAATR